MKDKILTIPNLMSMFRIILIPFIILTYRKEMYDVAVVLFILSWITDIVDGQIARRCNMVSSFGKVLDPVADKLTQGLVMLALAADFPIMIPFFIVFFLVQMTMIVDGLFVIKKTGDTYSAGWQGKLATGILDAVIIIHVVWHEIGQTVSSVLILISMVMMGVSLGLYLIQNVKRMHKGRVNVSGGERD